MSTIDRMYLQLYIEPVKYIQCDEAQVIWAQLFKQLANYLTRVTRDSKQVKLYLTGDVELKIQEQLAWIHISVPADKPDKLVSLYKVIAEVLEVLDLPKELPLCEED
jgi:hypothetical protein